MLADLGERLRLARLRRRLTAVVVAERANMSRPTLAKAERGDQSVTLEIGNAVTVATTLHQRITEFNTLIRDGQVRRSELEAFITEGIEMVELVECSALRASALITNFKQVAVDKTSELRRQFDLREVVKNNLAILRPGFRQKPWIFLNEIPSGIVCDGFPGSLGQVITNLIQNAALHAFETREQGIVTLSAYCTGECINLSITDNGIGMDENTATKVFDPFFTTKLGVGSCFTVNFPIKARGLHLSAKCLT